jgi:hypothetical protein
MKTLFRQYKTEVSKAYILYVPSIEQSVEMANRALKSCENVGQDAELYEGFDGTSGEIIAPDNLKDQNWYFVNRAHAYSIDPFSAKRLFVTLLDRGIYESIDIMMRLDDFCINQFDLYAYDLQGPTTLKDKKQ